MILNLPICWLFQAGSILITALLNASILILLDNYMFIIFITVYNNFIRNGLKVICAFPTVLGVTRLFGLLAVRDGSLLSLNCFAVLNILQVSAVLISMYTFKLFFVWRSKNGIFLAFFPAFSYYYSRDCRSLN